MIKIYRQLSLCFRWKVSYLNTSHSSSRWGLESPKDSSLTLGYRVFILLFSLFPFFNLGFDDSRSSISHHKLACDLTDCRISRFWEQKYCLKRDIFDVNVMLDHLKWADWVDYISLELNLFEGYWIVETIHH